MSGLKAMLLRTKLLKTTSLRACAFAFAIAAGLSGCGGEASQDAAPSQPTSVAAGTEAKAAADAFDDAVRKENWPLAKAQADVLFDKYPDSAAAKRIKAQYDEVKQKAEAARETARIAALWSYDQQSVSGGVQTSASIYAKEDVDVDGSGPTPVRLIFRDHPSWGRSSYLVLQKGDFNCYGGCKVMVKVDDKPAKAMAATRPKTDEAIAMFIDDARALWRMSKGAKTIAIEFPAKGMGKRSAVFEVAGVDRGKLPKWQ